ncbi:polyphenol oxidase family protein [Nocardioides cynanchi]|uniref:polyphenol oxidase family protein n=1 Tax=Nocardioides cynanchi TaxID=2558918 RepID=UPI001245F560|nr:polyphenol oxidase family protein [Nocardioides cynanchi]
MYAARLTHGPVELAFTDRHGGVSGAPYDSLNLAWAEDDPDALAENHRRLMADFAPGDRLAELSQVHGNTVSVIGPEGPSHAVHGHLHAVADGVVTAEPGVTLMVRAADCVPVLVASDDGAAIGAAHCGRPGLVAGIVPATVAAVRGLAAGPLTAWVGPYVCGACYEVPPEMQDDVAAVEPASRATTSWGTPALDVGAGVRAQLERDGVRVVDLSRCTRESADLFSYRRDGGVSGRQAGIIRRSR